MMAITVNVPAMCACWCTVEPSQTGTGNGNLFTMATSVQQPTLDRPPLYHRHISATTVFLSPRLPVRVVESFDCILFNWPINETLSPKKLQTGDSISLKKIRSLNNDTIIPVPRAILGCYIDRAGPWYQNLLSFLCQEARGSSHALKYGAASMLCDKRRQKLAFTLLFHIKIVTIVIY